MARLAGDVCRALPLIPVPAHRPGMASLFSAPSTPKEDPAIAAMREREQRRAEADRLSQTQTQLAGETARRRGMGLRGLLGPLGFGNLPTSLGSG